MTRDEFADWIAHFATRFPTTGDWVLALPRATLDVWFGDVFERLELRDCLAVNVSLMESGEIEAWQRERIPSLFIKRCQDIAYARRQRENRLSEEESVERHTMRAAAGRAFRDTLAEVRRRRESGQDVDVASIVDTIMAQVDDDAEEHDSGRWVKCSDCQDSGLVSFRDHKGRPYAGHCTCEKGIAKRDAYNARGRTLGMAPQQGVREWSFD